MMTAAISSKLPSAGVAESRVHVVTVAVPSDSGIRCAASMAARIFSCPQSRPRLGRRAFVFAAGKDVDGKLVEEVKLEESQT